MPVVSNPLAGPRVSLTGGQSNSLLGPIPGTTSDNSNTTIQNGRIIVAPFTPTGSPANVATPTTTQQSPQVIDPEGGPTTSPTNVTTNTQTPTVSTVPASLDTNLPQVSLSDYMSISAALLGVTQPNCLNAFYNPTYHFRFFTCGDADILEQVANNLGNLSQINQITIVESGVTGASIKEVLIKTQTTFGSSTKNQIGIAFEMTVIDPLGMTFLDGLVDAAHLMNLSDYTKAPYFLEVSFKGYDEGGNPISPSQLPNNGIWIWAVIINKVNTKINEGGGVFKLTLTAIGSTGAFAFGTSHNEEQRLPSQSLTVSGTTVKDIFQDFTTKINGAWKNSTGGALVSVAGIVTHPIAIGPRASRGIDPGTFVLKAQTPFQSSQRSWQFDTSGDGSVTCHIPPNASVAEFITAVIQSTEQGQQLMTNVPINDQVDMSQTQVTSNGYREVVVFAVEPDIMNTSFDTNTNNYIKQVTFHVVAHSSLNVILSQTQLAQASTPTVQSAILQNMITNKLINKRYDFIYTGLNTEVLNFDINWDMQFATILPKLWGTRAGYNNASVNGVLNQGNTLPQGTRYQAANELDVDPNTTSTVVPGQNPNSTQTPTPATVGTTTSTAGPTIAAPASLTTAAATAPGIASTPKLSNLTGTASSQVIGGTMKFIEDFEDTKTLGSPLPISFKYGNNNIAQESGASVTPGQFHRGQSVTGAIFAQLYGNDLLTSNFMQIQLEIRGDPYWLGQTNLDRAIINRTGQPTFQPEALPDHVSAKYLVYLHFQYPLTVGDDFVPVLSPSEAFNGIYEVMQVDHSFVDGQFKQVLHLNRHPMLDDSSLSPVTQQATSVAASVSQSTSASGGFSA